METLSPSLYLSTSSWFSQSTEWTREENKKFERALAIFDEHEPYRWLKVAAMLPGKTVRDVIKQYKELEEDVSDIEAGRVPIPGYHTSSFKLEDTNLNIYRKRSFATRTADQQRKKGVPWTEEEHRRFLMGLLKHGKGDWRNISRNFVVSKTPTQVASHAQKYFIRQQQLSGLKDKRRPSIHDITTISLTEASPSNSVSDKTCSIDGPNVPLSQQKPTGLHKVMIHWNHSVDESITVFNPTGGDLFGSTSHGISPDSLKLVGHNLYADAHIGARPKPSHLVFQRPSARHQIHE